MGEEENFEHCYGVPMMRYSVFEGLSDSLLEKSQEWTELRVKERSDKLKIDSDGENEMYSCESSAYRWKNTAVADRTWLSGVV